MGDKCDEVATELCDCEQAKSYVRGKKRKEQAFQIIDSQFGETKEEKGVDENILKLLNQMAEMVMENDIISSTVDVGKGLKAKIYLTSKGYIKIEKVKTKKTAHET